MHTLIRKIISTFFAGSASALFFTVTLLNGQQYGYFSLFGIVSFIAFPVVLIYGSLVSFALEYTTDRWVPSGPIRIAMSGLGHAVFGALFGAAASPGKPGQWFIWLCAGTAFLYFAVDLLLRAVENKPWRRYVRISMLALPVIAVGGFALF